jgi:hypothetical protein
MAQPIQLLLFPDHATLARIRSEANEWRFYRLAIWPDLFGRALLARRWGRIGTQSRLRLDPHPDLGTALAGSPLPFPPAQTGLQEGKTEGTALAHPPGRRAPWTRHSQGAANRDAAAHD